MIESTAVLVQLAECRLAEVPPDDEWLTPAERAVLAGLTVAKRRADWRLGRWCAKQALLALAPGAPGDLEILAAADGAPVASHRTRPSDRSQLPVLAALSLSHRDGRAAAVAGPAGLRLGCDLERVETRSEPFIRDYFTAAEAAHVLAHQEPARTVLANLCWSAKEAVLKAERVGLRADTRAVAVSLPTSLAEQDWQALHARSESAGDYEGWWRLQGDWLLTVMADSPHRLRSAQSVF